MVRPRNALLASFPEGSISPEEASDVLRQHNGDLEAAKKAVAVKLSNSLSTTGLKAPETRLAPLPERIPPKTVAAVNNLSDRQYACVWGVEVFEDGYRPDVARSLLARVARHVNPILRERGWRVKRLIESASKTWIGLCTTNGRGDADAASVNIQLNLRTSPSKHCKTFRSFQQVLSVMLHEITHTSIGLEDIHPPAFYELLGEIRQQYYEKLDNGEVELETDDYGCKNFVVTQSGDLKTIEEAAQDTIRDESLGQLAQEGECGARKRRRWRGGRKRPGASKGYTSNVPKRRPLLKGSKMVDGRTKAAKESKWLREAFTPQELAARAALARFEQADQGSDVCTNTENHDNISTGTHQSESDDELDRDEFFSAHVSNCGCRSCAWDRLLCR